MQVVDSKDSKIYDRQTPRCQLFANKPQLLIGEIYIDKRISRDGLENLEVVVRQQLPASPVGWLAEQATPQLTNAFVVKIFEELVDIKGKRIAVA